MTEKVARGYSIRPTFGVFFADHHARQVMDSEVSNQTLSLPSNTLIEWGRQEYQ